MCMCALCALLGHHHRRRDTVNTRAASATKSVGIHIIKWHPRSSGGSAHRQTTCSYEGSNGGGGV